MYTLLTHPIHHDPCIIYDAHNTVILFKKKNVRGRSEYKANILKRSLTYISISKRVYILNSERSEKEKCISFTMIFMYDGICMYNIHCICFQARIQRGRGRTLPPNSKKTYL